VIRVLDYIFLLRPSLMVPSWTFLLLGYYHATGKLIHLSTAFWWAFFIMTLLMGGTYILNQIVDRESDRINRKLFLISEGYIAVRSAYIYMCVLWVAAMGLSLWRFPRYGYLFIIGIIMGVTYSLPPFKFKARPFIDIIWNAIGYGYVNFLIGWMTGNPITIRATVIAIPYVLLVAGVFVNTTILDIEGDKKVGELTTGVYLGANRAAKLALVLMVLTVVISYILRVWIALGVAVFALPFYISAGLRGRREDYFLSVRLSAPIPSIIMSIFYPIFIPIWVLMFFSMRWYYKKRFDLIYPKLIG